VNKNQFFQIIVLGIVCWKYCCQHEAEVTIPHGYGPKPVKYKQYQPTTPPSVETAIIPPNSNVKEKSQGALDNIPTIIYETSA
jgi:hypothetical protein